VRNTGHARHNYVTCMRTCKEAGIGFFCRPAALTIDRGSCSCCWRRRDGLSLTENRIIRPLPSISSVSCLTEQMCWMTISHSCYRGVLPVLPPPAPSLGVWTRRHDHKPTGRKGGSCPVPCVLVPVAVFLEGGRGGLLLLLLFGVGSISAPLV
jgi:hypothetical protein